MSRTARCCPICCTATKPACGATRRIAVRAVIRRHAPRAQDFVNRRYRHRGVVDEVERAKNRTKSKVRARVEHSIGVIKRVLGLAKVRYRGLKKNAHRLIVTCALANLFMARRHLLRCQGAQSAGTAPVRCTGNRIRPKTAHSRPPCRWLTKFLFHFSMRQPLVQTFLNNVKTAEDVFVAACINNVKTTEDVYVVWSPE